jgi:hypothetical protein
MVLSTSPSSWHVLRLAHGAHHLHVHGGCRLNKKNALFLNLCVPSRTIFQLSIGDKSKKNAKSLSSSSEDRGSHNEAPPYVASWFGIVR